MAAQKFLFADVDEFVEDVVQISVTLSNLNFLVEIDAQNPALVRQHTKQVEQLLQALRSPVPTAEAEACVGSCS